MEHQKVLEAALSEDFNIVQKMIEGFDFDGALEVLQRTESRDEH